MKTTKTMINAMASRWRNSVPPQEKQVAGTNEVCPHCGAQFTPYRLSLREMTLATVCGALLLSILLPAGWMAKQWMDRQEDLLLDHLYWHEPLDSWSL
jgi:hypothetical protein